MNPKQIIMLFLMLSVSFLLFSCASNQYSSFYRSALSAGLEEVELRYSKIADQYSKVEFREYTVDNVRKTDVVEQGNTGYKGRLIHRIRKKFDIIDLNSFAINSESLFYFSRDGYLIGSPRTAIFYGSTARSDYPFTMSLVADPKTRIMKGQATRKNFSIDIVGDSFFRERQKAHTTETGFALYFDERLVGLINLTEKPTMFMYPNIGNEDLETLILFSFAFLFTYERSSRHLIQ